MRKKFISYFLSSLLCVAAACLGAAVYLFHHQVIDFSALEHYDPGRASIVLDCDGIEWTRFQLDRREPIRFDEMPQHVIHAFIAAEDWYFFSHWGISYKGIIRSVCVNLYNGRIVQGASTITQQLVKLLFLDAKKTYTRKIKEQLCALLVETYFTKDQILEAYLNHVYFGCGIYGIQAATMRFWNKPASEITIDEAAMLAAVVRSPAAYCPLLSPLSAQKRRNLVLKLMRDRGFISTKECDDACEKPLWTCDSAQTGCAPHLRESLRQFLEEKFGKSVLYTGGLTIKTTINQQMQREAERIFSAQCAAVENNIHRNVDGALVAMRVHTGEICALVGGTDFAHSKFNRAMQARRQMGSVFKPIVYAAALEAGASLADVECDEPIEFPQSGGVWRPNNYNKQFEGPITRAYALSHSNNVVTIKTLLRAGIDRVIDCAKRCQLPGPFHPYPSLALGCVDATMIDVMGMMNIFAHNGVYVEPYYISWVKDRWGAKIYKSQPKKVRALDAPVSGKIAHALTLGLKRIRPHFEQWIKNDALCKTGTTNDSRTCWFVGSTPDITTAVYIGCDDNRSMGKNVYPLRTAFPAWLDFNRAIETTPKQFFYDPSLREIMIHERTGELASTASPEVITILE